MSYEYTSHIGLARRIQTEVRHPTSATRNAILSFLCLAPHRFLTSQHTVTYRQRQFTCCFHGNLSNLPRVISKFFLYCLVCIKEIRNTELANFFKKIKCKLKSFGYVNFVINNDDLFRLHAFSTAVGKCQESSAHPSVLTQNFSHPTYTTDVTFGENGQ